MKEKLELLDRLHALVYGEYSEWFLRRWPARSNPGDPKRWTIVLGIDGESLMSDAVDDARGPEPAINSALRVLGKRLVEKNETARRMLAESEGLFEQITRLVGTG